MITGFRALCAKVLAYSEGVGDYDFNHLNSYDRENAVFDAWQEIKAELKSALATSQPKPPTVMEIIELADEVEAAGLGQVDLVRTALARWSENSQFTNHSAHVAALQAAVDEVIPEAPEPTPDSLDQTVDFGYAWAIWDTSQSIRKKFNALIDKLR